MKLQSRAGERQIAARKKLQELWCFRNLSDDELMVNLHLYMRSSVVAKMLYVNELYQKIVDVPGVIMEFGVWYGANMALFENLRAVYEPYNYTRKVIGFDTFDGYVGYSEHDNVEFDYSLPHDYEKYLDQVLNYHQQENVMPHIKKYEICKGDVQITIDEYLKAHPETIIALAYFDLGLYAPTKRCLEAIMPYTHRGTVIAMDELGSEELPGETMALQRVIGTRVLRLKKSKFLPDRTYFTVGDL